MSEPRFLRVLSLGAGVQSSTLLLLSARGELPRLDAAIFADTGWEPAAVYEHLTWLESAAAAAGIPVHRVSRGNLREHILAGAVPGRTQEKGRRWASMPLFVDPGDGPRGMIRRQCTKEFKIEPIRRKLRELGGLQPGERAGKKIHVEQWVGISADEARRLRLSRDYWITLRYPLVFDLKPAWRRQDCLRWLAEHYPERRVPRSACIGCPFHSNAEWRALRDHDPTAWDDAVAFDAAIRVQGGLDGRAYLHGSLRPLAEAPIDDDDPNQQSLFTCGVCAT